MCLLAETGKRVTILDLKVNQDPKAAKYKGNAVALVESTTATIIQVCNFVFSNRV